MIMESSLETAPDYFDETYYELIKIKEYKTNQHVFLRVRGTQNGGENEPIKN